MQFMRFAIAGGFPGPNLQEMMAVLGKKEVFERLEMALVLFKWESEELRKVIQSGLDG